MSSQSSLYKLDLRQTIKLIVYTLLLVNFGLYIADDLTAASHTMRNGGSLLEWTRSFATSIDESAWFALLFLFELETYVLSDEVQSRPWIVGLVHAIRLVCYASLMHTIYAFAVTYADLAQVTAAVGVTELCQLVGNDVSFVRNLAYTQLTADNCATLSMGGQFYFVEPALVVTDGDGWALEKQLALVDLVDSVVWILILFTIEAMVRLQDRSITRGTVVRSIKISKLVLYTLLWGHAAYWFSLGHWYFAWDEALWIVGFIAIEMNVDDWKKEIEHEQTVGESGISEPRLG